MAGRNLREIIGKEILFSDGAMGTQLQKMGLVPGELPESWNILHPEKILEIHRGYLRTGVDFLSANTFGVNRYKLEGTGFSVQELVSAGVKLALEACREEEARRKAMILDGRAVCGPGFHDKVYCMLDVGSLGRLLRPLGNLAFEDAVETFAQVMRAGAAAGAEGILIETFTDNYEMKAAVLAAKENTHLPVFVTMVPDERGKLLTGGDIASVTAMLEGLGADAIGFNCGFGPEQILKFLPELTACCSVPVMIQPNAGLPVVRDQVTTYDVSPEEFAQSVQKLVMGGAHIVGGCCGTDPDYIREEIRACRELKLCPVTEKNITVVSSYSHAVTFGKKPLIIGERINPTGKKRFKQALREKDLEYILKEGIGEEEHGAEILDVNVGLPEINEPEMMEAVVTGLQGILDLPLQIDTTDPAAMERALRVYNGKPMINSVNGKQESMDMVFPLVKKYGGVLVCLTLDENGIPETAGERVEIARKIIKKAEKYGISKKDLVIDPLTMTVSTGDNNGNVTLDALDIIRHELGVHTVLGVSNISFGLPQRNTITASFFTMAMTRGLSSGIVNPSSDALMNAYYSYLALSGLDPQCLKYIDRFSQAQETVVTSSAGTPSGAAAVKSAAGPEKNSSLHEAVVRGMGESAARAAGELLKTREPLSIIDGELIPALDEVGKGFEQKKIFLPQLLMSADAAKAAFETIRLHLEKSGVKNESRGKILMATVKGDIHDIGKNIVKVLLQNYDFEVLDLGKDVPPEKIVETAVAEKIPLIGLSALMTTTVTSMEETIRQLRESGHPCKVMVGGAVLTQEYADMIGADFYSGEAMGSVRYACSLAEEGFFEKF